MSPPSPRCSGSLERSAFFKIPRESKAAKKLNLKEKPFLLPLFFVILARGFHPIFFRNFRDRNVPPGFVAGHSLVIGSLQHYYRRSVLLSAFRQCRPELICCSRSSGPSAQTRGVRRKIYRQNLAVIFLAAAKAIVGSHAFVPACAAESTDT